MEPNWYEHFFHGVVLDLWRKAVTPDQTRAEVDFLIAELDAVSGGRYLDVPCGNGRHSLELASRGYRAVGVDIAGEFIQEARKRAAEGGLGAEFRQGDQRVLPWQAEFDGAFCMGNSFAYLDHQGNREFLRALSGTLKSGARFLLNAGAVAETILPSFHERNWYQGDDIHLLIENRYVAADSRLETTYTFLRDGKLESRVGSHQIYTAAEIRRLLQEAGLIPVTQYGSLDRKPFQLGSPELYLVSRKE